MDSKLVKEWMEEGLKPSKDFEFFTRRPDVVVGKLVGKPAQVEYVCPHCGFYETKEIEMEKIIKGGKESRKFKRPKFKCSKCGKTITVESLKKKK
jgi:DNA-directed RNA polymerase subunit RPC12/RpoP